MITELGRLLEDEHPNHPQNVLERARRPTRSMGSLARALQDYITGEGLALPTDQAERLAAGRRQRFARTQKIILTDPTRGLTATPPRGFSGQTIALDQQRALFCRWTTSPDAHPHALRRWTRPAGRSCNAAWPTATASGPPTRT